MFIFTYYSSFRLYIYSISASINFFLSYLKAFFSKALSINFLSKSYFNSFLVKSNKSAITFKYSLINFL